MKKIKLTEKDLEFVCPMKVEEMTTLEGGYFCDKCDKKVHDVSNFSKDEFQALKSKNSHLCITFKKVVTLGAMLSFSACSPVQTSGKISQDSRDKANCNSIVPSENNNSLKPFSAVNPNKEHEVNIAGGKMVPPHLKK